VYGRRNISLSCPPVHLFIPVTTEKPEGEAMASAPDDVLVPDILLRQALDFLVNPPGKTVGLLVSTRLKWKDVFGLRSKRLRISFLWESLTFSTFQLRRLY